nr:hypothetical protein GCM10020241_40930 [Streptoalloteichus tenebrarius]
MGTDLATGLGAAFGTGLRVGRGAGFGAGAAAWSSCSGSGAAILRRDGVSWRG